MAKKTYRPVEEYETYWVCPRRYKLRYIDKIPMPISDWRARTASLRTTVLKFFEARLLKREMRLQEMIDMFAASYEDLSIRVEKRTRRGADWAVRRAHLALRVFLEDHAPMLDPVDVAVTFEGEFAGHPISVFADLVDRLQVGTITTSVKRMHSLWISHSLSMCSMVNLSGTSNVYKLGFCLGEYVTVSKREWVMRRPNIAWAEYAFKSILEAIEAGVFPTKGPNSPLCKPRRCVYSRICRSEVMENARRKAKG